jgi:hypothetical protein
MTTLYIIIWLLLSKFATVKSQVKALHIFEKP